MHADPAAGGADGAGTGQAEDPARASADADAGLGGEPACWAHLVCPECGAIEAEGHTATCPTRSGPG
jgi:hypothetical protein